MDKDDMLGFLRRFRTYLEYWNSYGPPTEYLPNFTKVSATTCQECEYIMTEIVSNQSSIVC